MLGKASSNMYLKSFLLFVFFFLFSKICREEKKQNSLEGGRRKSGAVGGWRRKQAGFSHFYS